MPAANDAWVRRVGLSKIIATPRAGERLLVVRRRLEAGGEVEDLGLLRKWWCPARAAARGKAWRWLYDERRNLRSEPGDRTVTGSLQTGRYAHTATLLANGKVLVAGGTGGPTVLASAELYDPTTGTWTVTGSLHDAHAEHTATLLADGRVLVIGGYDNDDVVPSAEIYDPATGTWAITGSLNLGRYRHAASGAGGRCCELESW